MDELDELDELVERVDTQDRVLGVVGRQKAVREGWLHRVSVAVCRDGRGHFLVHRRAAHLSRFPGHWELGAGGAVGVGESYEEAAVREVGEELGTRVTVRPLFKFLNRAGFSPHWLTVCDAVLLPEGVVRDPDEVAAHVWLTESEVCRALREWTFTPDSREIAGRYFGGGTAAARG